MQRIVRHNMSGGKLGKSLWTRSDLEAYHKGNHVQTNFQSTPYGGITRRAPAELLGSLPFKQFDGTWYQPSVIRGFSFVYDIETKYSILLVSYTADGEDDQNWFEVLSDDGILKASISAPYDSSIFYEIDNKQVNDIIMFAHNDHAPARLVRYGDEDWRYELLQFEGGPFLESNSDQSYQVGVGLSTWRDDFGYQAGDIVLPQSGTSGTASWLGTFYSFVKESSLVSDLAEASTWVTQDGDDYYIDDLTFVSKLSTVDRSSYEGKVFYPLSIIQVDKTFSGSLIVGDSIACQMSYVETGGDTSFVQSSEIIEIKSGTVYDYLVIDFGWNGFYVQEDGKTLIDPIYCGFPDDGSVPRPQFPDDSETYWTSRWGSFGIYYNYNSAHVIVGSNTSGGAYVSATANNIVKGDTSGSTYKAKVANTNNVVTDTDYWESIATPDGSPLVLIQATSFAPFSENDEGRIFGIESAESASLAGSYNSVTTSDTRFATGTVTFTTSGLWSGEMILESSSDSENWEIIGSVISVDQGHNGTITRTIYESGVEVRVRMIAWTDGECNWTLNTEGYRTIYTIAEYISSTRVLARLVTGYDGFYNSSLFAFGAFGGSAGYPSTITIHEERLMLGGTNGRPFEIYGSEVNNWVNFTIGTLETSPIIFRLQSDNVTRICWLISSQSRLFIGTDFGEYSASTPDENTVLSGSNPPRITLHTTYGSDEQKAISIHNEVAHITADRMTMRSIAEGEYKNTYGSKDLTVFSPDIASEGIASIALQRNPYPIIWARTTDGKLAPFTYDVENGIMGWSEVELENSLVKSHWIMPNDDGVDEVYMSIERDDISTFATGTSSPSVAGLFESNNSAYVFEDSSSVFIAPSQGLDLAGYYEYADDKKEVSYKTEGWQVFQAGVINVLATTSPKPLPPKNGYETTGGDPTTASVLASIFVGDDYIITQNGSLYTIADISDGVEYFESADLYGEYTPISGSGATGSVTISQLNNHIIKLGELGKVRGDNVDILGETYDSTVELTSMIQGQGVLEADKVKVSKMHVYLVESYGGEVSVDGGRSWVAIRYDDENLYTGMKSVIVDSSVTDDLRIMVRATGEDPFELTGVSIDVDPQTTSTGRNK